MIDHSNCDHERTSSARARCRREKSGGAPRKTRSTPREPSGGDEPEYGVHKSRTPGFKSDECHICSIERIVYAGTDSFTHIKVLVGEGCKWRVARSEDFRVISP